MARPVLLVLAGVNGAGKSSIGGNLMLRRAGMAWFNPDAYTALLVQTGLPLEQANAQAWHRGVELLDQAIAAGHSHAFETTLGGRTLTGRIAAAAKTHDLLIWYCGLATPEQHIARVALRVAAGGHAIADSKIRERWLSSPLNLIGLLPRLTELRMYDNSSDAAPGQPVTDPVPVLHVANGKICFPLELQDLQSTPAWAKPIVQAARSLGQGRG